MTHWPRLERWRAQDAEGGLLREQLRTAAKLWDDKDRPDELLWSGRTFREFALWREGYPGRLTPVEESFAERAASLAGRRRRRNRMATAALLGAALATAIVTSSLWQRSEKARQKAESEALRAEAAKLLALGQVELERYPTAAIAYALRSLELADGHETRLFALRALQRGPTAVVVPRQGETAQVERPAFSPNGAWLALCAFGKVQVRHRDGRDPIVLGGYPEDGSRRVVGRIRSRRRLLGDRPGWRCAGLGPSRRRGAVESATGHGPEPALDERRRLLHGSDRGVRGRDSPLVAGGRLAAPRRNHASRETCGSRP